ncbi:MAG: DMT family transporter [Flavobacteriaceae bacterium]
MSGKAIWWMILSALSFALLNVLIKYLNHFNVFQIIFFRSIGTLIFTIPFILKYKIPFFGNQKILLATRALIGFTAMGLFFASIKFLPVGSAVSIRYVSPIFASFFAIFLLNERVKFSQWICFFVAFFGVVLLKGFSSEMTNIGLMLAILSAIFTGLVFIVIRKIGTNDHPVIVVNYFMLFSAIIGGVLMLQCWIIPNGIEWVILLSLGVFGYFGQVYMTKAVQQSEINAIAPLKYIEVVFTIIIGVIYFDETYTTISVFAIILIISGLYFNTLFKSQNKTR